MCRTAHLDRLKSAGGSPTGIPIRIEPYFTHLLRLAGTEIPLFKPDAIEALHQATQGLPRKLNLYAHHALIAAAVAEHKTVTADHVQIAMDEVR